MADLPPPPVPPNANLPPEVVRYIMLLHAKIKELETRIAALGG